MFQIDATTPSPLKWLEFDIAFLKDLGRSVQLIAPQGPLDSYIASNSSVCEAGAKGSTYTTINIVILSVLVNVVRLQTAGVPETDPHKPST
eukprot:4783174-Amphidinium_carterae.1